MTSFLSAAQKAQINAVFDDIHDTFKRNINVYKKGQETLIDLGGGGYNNLYDREKDSKNTPPSYEKYTIDARIKYIGEGKEDELLDKRGLQVEFPYGGIRLKLDKTAYDLLISSKRVEVDGQMYKVKSEASRTGPFGANYYIIYLQRED